MQGQNEYKRGGGQIRKRDRRVVRGSVEARGISIDRINIISGRAGGLEATLRSLRRGNIDVDVLQDTKLTDGIHTQQGAGYAFWAT